MRASIILTILLAACGQQMSKEDREAAMEEMKNQEVRKVDKADIYAKALEEGRIAADLAQATLVSHLQKHIQDPVGALVYCNTRAYPLLDSLSETTGVQIRRASFQYRNPSDAPDSIESLLLESYQYSIERSEPVGENIQEYDEYHLLYTRPIVVASPMCLTCHGTDIEPALKDAIAERYPDDKALNHQLDDLRGMWSVKVPVKEIVKGLE